MNYKRALTIQDISCFGQCSLTVALPIISACGVEACPIPSAVLSTHTGGFSGYTFRDLTDDIPKISSHWQSLGIEFDAIYTGYLGSKEQVAYVCDILDVFGRSSIKIIDPAMADRGKLYTGFDENFVEVMKKLIPKADYLLPNLTEACLLTGEGYCEHMEISKKKELLKKLYEMGAKNVILTGECFIEGQTGFILYDGKDFSDYSHEKLQGCCHGTGDIYTSTFTGVLLNGFCAYEAAKTAASFVVDCIKCTSNDPNHTYGARFEPVLYKLCERIRPYFSFAEK